LIKDDEGNYDLTGDYLNNILYRAPYQRISRACKSRFRPHEFDGESMKKIGKYKMGSEINSANIEKNVEKFIKNKGSYVELPGIYINNFLDKNVYTISYHIADPEPNHKVYASIKAFWREYERLQYPMLSTVYRVRKQYRYANNAFPSYISKNQYIKNGEVHETVEYVGGINNAIMDKGGLSYRVGTYIDICLRVTEKVITNKTRPLYLPIYTMHVDTDGHFKNRYLIASQGGAMIENISGKEIFDFQIDPIMKPTDEIITVGSGKNATEIQDIKHITFGGGTSIERAPHDDDDDYTSFLMAKLFKTRHREFL
jgi:hypothetical protein